LAILGIGSAYITAPDKMLLLNLPTELVSEILVRAVLARGVKRALRLRLVCSMFCILSAPATASPLQLIAYA